MLACLPWPGVNLRWGCGDEEVGRWMTEGLSLFARQWQAIQETIR